MSKKRKSIKIPALVDGERLAVTDKEKADMLGRTLAAVHSGEHLSDIHRQQKQQLLAENENVKEKRQDNRSALDVEFTMSELKIALQGTGYTAPGQDQLCYAMFRQLPMETMTMVLSLFNTIWREGDMPSLWKTAVVLPFNKPGKDTA